MIILGIHIGHGASAALMINGEIIRCFQEERFTKIKNFEGYPKKSIQECLDCLKSKKLNIDIAAFSSKHFFGRSLKYPLQNFFSIKDFKAYYGEEYYDLKIQGKSTKDFFKKLKFLKKKRIKSKLLLDSCPDKKLENNNYLKFLFERNLFNQSKAKKVKISKVEYIDHHECHASYAYYSIEKKDPKIAVLTIDSMGDFYNQTLWIPNKKNEIENINRTNQCDLARIYKLVTLILSMKPNEHEFKVMGLAPYAKSSYSIIVYEKVFKNLLKVKNCQIVHDKRPKNLYRYLERNLRPYRFDNIAGGIQLFLEKLTSDLFCQIEKKYKIQKFSISGGVSMNIKMNMFLHKQKFVKKLYVASTGTDDSLSLGACYAVAKNNSKILKNIYLGRSLINEKCSLEKEVLSFVGSSNRYKLINKPTFDSIAKLLSRGEILAIAQGREEFGARALGNRSIIANPSDLSVIKKINEMIKNRDFWMPFALTILDEHQSRFIENKKKIDCKYMTIGFETKNKNLKMIKAGTHQYDNTVRPQFLTKQNNPLYYNVIKSFYNITKIPALLNTSLNLHGYPISSSIDDVFYTFKNSGLKYLLIEKNFLIKKK